MGKSVTEIKSAGDEIYAMLKAAPRSQLGDYGPQYALASWDNVKKARKEQRREEKKEC